MATKRKNNKKPGKAAKITLRVFAALLLVLAALAGIGVLNANVVRIRRAEVLLADLPEAFDGVSMLYASDIEGYINLYLADIPDYDPLPYLDAKK